jgi:Tfp pilus assembly protein PilF
MRLITESWPAFHDILYVLWRDNPQKRAVLFRKSAQIYSSLGKQYLIGGDYQRARINCQKALTYQPWSWRAMRRLGLTYLPVIRDWYRHRKMKQNESLP